MLAAWFVVGSLNPRSSSIFHSHTLTLHRFLMNRLLYPLSCSHLLFLRPHILPCVTSKAATQRRCISLYNLMFICIRLCVTFCLYIGACARAHIYTYTYTHTHTYIYIYSKNVFVYKFFVLTSFLYPSSLSTPFSCALLARKWSAGVMIINYWMAHCIISVFGTYSSLSKVFFFSELSLWQNVAITAHIYYITTQYFHVCVWYSGWVVVTKVLYTQ